MSDVQRTDILQAFDARLWALFNGTDGSIEALFREHRRGPLKHQTTCPAYTGSDNGQEHLGGGDNESANRRLKIRVTCHIAENWDRSGGGDDWSNRVELISKNLSGRPGYGIMDIRYAGDDPLDAVFLSGETQAVWVIDFEVDYCVEQDEFDDWT